MIKTLEYNRRWSIFAPDYTYAVTDLVQNRWIGEVARMKDNPRKWWASNITWTGGADLARTFRTRYEAAVALRWIADGGDPEDVGGYVAKEEQSASS